MTDVAATAEAILVAHQRKDIGSCLCGWDQLGASHPRHQVQMLTAAGLLAPSRAPIDGCGDHRPVQHRDARPPWCERCGRGADGTLIKRG